MAVLPVSKQPVVGHQTAAVASSAAVTFGGAVVGAGLMFVNEVLIARWLDAEVYGLYALGIVLVRISEVVSAFGLKLSVMHFVPLYLNEKRPEMVRGTVYGALLLPIAIGLVLSVLLFVGAPAIANRVFHLGDATPYIRYLALALLLVSLCEMIGVITRSFGKSIYYVIVRNLMPNGVFFVLLVCVYLFDLPKFAVVYAYVGAFSVAFVVAVVCLLRVLRPIGARGPVKLQPGRLYGYAFPLFFNAVFYMVIGWTDILMLGALGTEKDVGIYRACMQIVVVFDLVWLALAAAAAPAFAMLDKSGPRDEFDQTYRAVRRWTIAMTLPICLVLAFNARGLLEIMGAEFVAGAATLALLAIGHFLRTYSSSAALLLSVTGRQRSETFNAVLSAVVNVVLNYVLIREFGLLGAGLATVAALLVLSVSRTVQVHVIKQLSWMDPRTVVTFALAFVVVGLSLCVFNAMVPDDINHFVVLALKIAFAGIPLIPVILFVGLTQADRSILVHLATKLRPARHVRR